MMVVQRIIPMTIVQMYFSLKYRMEHEMRLHPMVEVLRVHRLSLNYHKFHLTRLDFLSNKLNFSVNIEKNIFQLIACIFIHKEQEEEKKCTNKNPKKTEGMFEKNL